jgi:ATP synthase protein I
MMMRLRSPGSLRFPQPSARKLCIASAKPKLPTKGYFAEADPNAEVYSKSGKKFDPARKKGRWEPEFIWNTNWQEALALEEQQKKAQEEAAARPPEQPEGGFLNLNRLSDMNSMDSDLSAELRAPKAPAQPKIELPNMTTRPVYPKPTMFETRKWFRGGKFSEKVVPISPANEALIALEEARIAEEKVQYDLLKQEFQAWNLGLAAFTFVITYAFYTQDTAISYLAGALGGMAYLRLLNRQIDGIGGGDVGSALGPPRLLVPVILVLGYNR